MKLSSCPRRTRTFDQVINNHPLCRLSYRASAALPRLDSNQVLKIQSLACCQLHHKAIIAEPGMRLPRLPTDGAIVVNSSYASHHVPCTGFEPVISRLRIWRDYRYSNTARRAYPPDVWKSMSGTTVSGRMTIRWCHGSTFSASIWTTMYVTLSARPNMCFTYESSSSLSAILQRTSS